MIGPQTEGEWIKATHKAMSGKAPSDADRREYRKMLDLYPDLSKDYGELHKHFMMFSLEAFKSQPIVEESVKHRLRVMRGELSGPNPSPLEVLLVDAVIACYQDYWHFSVICRQKTVTSFTLQDMEKWERILASKETRYLRAIGELARVRRRLNLPAPQVNINLPGGQQLNVAGDVQT